ncbi:MAG: hypothetical protein ACE5E8_05110 [Acidimicrobiia bacterium]
MDGRQGFAKPDIAFRSVGEEWLHVKSFSTARTSHLPSGTTTTTCSKQTYRGYTTLGSLPGAAFPTTTDSALVARGQMAAFPVRALAPWRPRPACCF